MRDFKWLVWQFISIIDVLVLFVFALAFLYIVWQIINAWIIHGGEISKIEEGKKTILVAFIVMIVMASVWGIVAILRSSII